MWVHTCARRKPRTERIEPLRAAADVLASTCAHMPAMPAWQRRRGQARPGRHFVACASCSVLARSRHLCLRLRSPAAHKLVCGTRARSGFVLKQAQIRWQEPLSGLAGSLASRGRSAQLWRPGCGPWEPRRLTAGGGQGFLTLPKADVSCTSARLFSALCALGAGERLPRA